MKATEKLFCFLEPEIVRAIDTVIPDEMLAYLDLTGRQSYYERGIYGQGITVAVIDTGINDHQN
jgi:subtilisin family serine protease